MPNRNNSDQPNQDESGSASATPIPNSPGVMSKEHEEGKGAYPDRFGGGDNPAQPPETGFPAQMPPSPAAGEAPNPAPVRLGARHGYPEGLVTVPPPIEREDHPTHPYGTDKNYDDPADANLADMEAAGEEGHEAAPQPFRKRDQFPDLTSETVNMRMLQDYYPEDTGRHQNGDLPRARKDELVAFPPDEALALRAFGYAEREDEWGEHMANAQRQRWADRDNDRKRVEDEARRRRADDGA